MALSDLTPPAAPTVPRIYPGAEGVAQPSPTQGLVNWTAELAKLTPQAGLL